MLEFFKEEKKNELLSTDQLEWLTRYEEQLWGHEQPRTEPYALQSLAYMAVIDADCKNIHIKVSRKIPRKKQIVLLFQIRHQLTYTRCRYGKATPHYYWDNYVTNMYTLQLRQLKIQSSIKRQKWFEIWATLKIALCQRMNSNYGEEFAEKVLKILIRHETPPRRPHYINNHELLIDIGLKSAEILKSKLGRPTSRYAKYQNRPHITDRMNWNPREFDPNFSPPSFPKVTLKELETYSFERRPWDMTSILKRRLEPWDQYAWRSHYE